MKEGMRAEPPALTDEETALRNEKIRVDDFQDKMIHASRKVGTWFMGANLPPSDPGSILRVLLLRPGSVVSCLVCEDLLAVPTLDVGRMAVPCKQQ